MSAQAIFAIAVLGLYVPFILLGGGLAFRPHNGTHLHVTVLSFLTPLLAFKWDALGRLPPEVWAICVAGAAAQVSYVVYHRIRPDAGHFLGPEIFPQLALSLWALSLRPRIDPDLWFNGSVGAFLFCFELIFVATSVLMTIYLGGLTLHPADNINVREYALSSRSNAGLAAGAVGALFLTLFATFEQPWYLAAGAAAFLVMRYAMPITDEKTPK